MTRELLAVKPASPGLRQRLEAAELLFVVWPNCPNFQGAHWALCFILRSKFTLTYLPGSCNVKRASDTALPLFRAVGTVTREIELVSRRLSTLIPTYLRPPLTALSYLTLPCRGSPSGMMGYVGIRAPLVSSLLPRLVVHHGRIPVLLYQPTQCVYSQCLTNLQQVCSVPSLFPADHGITAPYFVTALASGVTSW